MISFSAIGFSQIQTTQEKVKDFLGEERFNEAKSSNPGLISFLEMKAENGFLLSESIEVKKSSYKKIDNVFFKKEEISIDDFLDALDQDDFNFLHYTFPNHDSNMTTHYLLGDSDILISVYSNAAINNKIASE